MVDVAQYTNEVKRDSEHLVVIQKVKVLTETIAAHLKMAITLHAVNFLG